MAGAGSVAALVPALLTWRNLALYWPPPPLTALRPASTRGESGGERIAVSVLIPARDEETGIGAAVAAALANHRNGEDGSPPVDVEVVVLDDQSTDRTAEIVRRFASLRTTGMMGTMATMAAAQRGAQVRLLAGEPLPAGWCGKQHACWQLARAASHPLLLFVDADVRLAPDAAARIAALLQSGGAPLGLVSGFPRQETVTWLERLLLPLMHFLLLGFLPLDRMRQSRHPAYGAGCGQLLMVRRDAYEAAGGHAAVRGSIHDGLALPRALRRAGFATDLFDATPLATCRMYHNAGEVWRGLLKNTLEGIGAPRTILPATLLLLAGQALPPVLLVLVLLAPRALGLPGWPPPPIVVVPAILGTVLAYAPRLAAARRFRQPLDGALLHPLAIVVLLLIQWIGLGRWLRHRPAVWKGRAYDPRPAA